MQTEKSSAMLPTQEICPIWSCSCPSVADNSVNPSRKRRRAGCWGRRPHFSEERDRKGIKHQSSSQPTRRCLGPGAHVKWRKIHTWRDGSPNFFGGRVYIGDLPTWDPDLGRGAGPRAMASTTESWCLSNYDLQGRYIPQQDLIDTNRTRIYCFDAFVLRQRHHRTVTPPRLCLIRVL